MGFSNDALLKIKNEINNDPATRGYLGKTYSEMSSLINEKISQTPQVFSGLNINPQQIALILIKRNKWEAVKSASDNAIATGHADAFKLWHLANLGNIVDDLTNAQLTSIITSLVSATILSNADASALRDASRTEILKSRSDVLGLGFISEADIRHALTV
jgi:hypothetical protein